MEIGYRYGSMREAWKPLHAGETDAALVRNQFVPELLEKGFNKLYDFVEDSKPHGRPDRVTVARKSFIERNPELLKRYWKATIRGYISCASYRKIFRSSAWWRARSASTIPTLGKHA